MGEDIAGGKGREQYQGTQDAWGGPFWCYSRIVYKIWW